MSARDAAANTTELRLRALERRVAELAAELAGLCGDDVTIEQPANRLEAGHVAFVERLRGAKR